MMFSMFIALALSQIAKSDFEFVEDLSINYCVVYGDYFHYGKLDQHGEFILDMSKSPLRKNPNGRTSVKGLFLYRVQGESNLVYELRSGMLIPGQLKDLRFIPEERGVIIKFVDYDVTKDKRYIYNLPGKFVYKPKR